MGMKENMDFGANGRRIPESMANVTKGLEKNREGGVHGTGVAEDFRTPVTKTEGAHIGAPTLEQLKNRLSPEKRDELDKLRVELRIADESRKAVVLKEINDLLASVSQTH